MPANAEAASEPNKSAERRSAQSVDRLPAATFVRPPVRDLPATRDEESARGARHERPTQTFLPPERPGFWHGNQDDLTFLIASFDAHCVSRSDDRINSYSSSRRGALIEACRDVSRRHACWSHRACHRRAEQHVGGLTRQYAAYFGSVHPLRDGRLQQTARSPGGPCAHHGAAPQRTTAITTGRYRVMRFSRATSL